MTKFHVIVLFNTILDCGKVATKGKSVLMETKICPAEIHRGLSNQNMFIIYCLKQD